MKKQSTPYRHQISGGYLSMNINRRINVKSWVTWTDSGQRTALSAYSRATWDNSFGISAGDYPVITLSKMFGH